MEDCGDFRMVFGKFKKGWCREVGGEVGGHGEKGFVALMEAGDGVRLVIEWKAEDDVLLLVSTKMPRAKQME